MPLSTFQVLNQYVGEHYWRLSWCFEEPDRNAAFAAPPKSIQRPDLHIVSESEAVKTPEYQFNCSSTDFKDNADKGLRVQYLHPSW